MNMKETSRRSLDQRLAALDPEIATDRDLWPSIVAKIGASDALEGSLDAIPPEAAPEFSAHTGSAHTGSAHTGPAHTGPARAGSVRRWPLALAAGFALVALVGALFGWQVARLRPATFASSPPPVFTKPQPTDRDPFAGPETESFRATRASLEQTYQQRLALLAPATRHRVEQDLATIRAANADIRKALEADPQSAVLNHLLASTLHEEFDLYTAVIRNSAPAVPRSPS